MKGRTKVVIGGVLGVVVIGVAAVPWVNRYIRGNILKITLAGNGEVTSCRNNWPPEALHPKKGLPVAVIKGGSYLCAPNFCRRYRPTARFAQDTLLGTNHIGFRTALYTPGPNGEPAAH